MEEQLKRAAAILAEAKRPVAFTGLGISRDSGIHTFRDVDGLWSHYPIEQFGTVPGLIDVAQRDPQRLVAFFSENFAAFLQATPNAGHETIAALEQRIGRFDVVTQNIDDLHERAGSSWVYKLHGDLFTLRCVACGERQTLDHAELSAAVEPFVALGRAGAGLTLQDLIAALPRCAACDGHLRPDVVMFGESLPQEAWHNAQEAVNRCDCLLVVGTAAEVAPASYLPTMALQKKIPIIEVNPRPVIQRADAILAGPAGELLPRPRHCYPLDALDSVLIQMVGAIRQEVDHADIRVSL